MKPRQLLVMAGIIFCVGSVMMGCDNADDGNDDDNTDDDDAESCHELGVPFVAPEGEIDPWRALETETCCGDGHQMTIVEEMSADECVRLEPLQFVCTEQNGDRDCDEHENFCTSPIDCAPPEGFTGTCCQEGDFCWRSNYSELPPSGVLGCCAGLEEVDIDSWNRNWAECIGAYSESTVICVLDCGDGDCTAGENPCNCPEDCPADEW